MSTARRLFFALAERNGIEVEYTVGRKAHPRTGEPVGWEITLDAPEGMAFSDSGCTVDCSLRGEGLAPDWPSALKALTEIVDYGFEPAEDEES